MVEIRGLNIVFESKKIINNFSLCVGSGERVALRGASGTGKSQILNAIMGLVRVESGSIRIKSIEMLPENIKQIRSLIAWVPQDYSAIADGSTYEIIQSVLRLAANRRLQLQESDIAKELSKVLLPGEILTNEFSTLSGGEKQRVAIVIAKLLDREIIILDEPSSALDDSSCAAVVDYIFEDKRKTIISISHDQRWLRSFGRVVDVEEFSENCR